MNIWYFHHYATPYSLPGLHRPFEFGGEFINQGHEISVFSSSYLHYSGENLIQNREKYLVKQDDGVSGVYIKTDEYANSGAKRVINMFQFFQRLFPVSKAYAKKTQKPDIIIASSPHPLTMMAGIRIAKKFGVPCICEVRDFWPEVFFTGGRLKETSLLGRILLWGECKIYEKCDGLVFLKEGDHTYITEHGWDKDSGGTIGMEKCYYINNGVDIQLFDQRKEKHQLQDEDLDDDSFKLVYCGAIRPVNNVGMLLDVAKILGNKCKVLIYGDGTCLPELKKRVEEEKIQNVELKGYVDNSYIPYILSKSSLNILNYSATDYNWSRGNSSNKMFEYLASAKPVLSTVQMGYDILSRYSCGISAQECTPESIAQAIKEFMDMEPEQYARYCDNARKTAGIFDIPALARDYLKVIETVKKKKHGKD